MKTRIKLAMVAALAVFFLAPTFVRAQDDGSSDDHGVSFQTFYDQLGDQGSWIQTGDYGYVWQPPVTDSDWSPYSDGYWVYTDDGWLWVSNESWGWATYHYGRWANIDGTGWVWVPGYQWAPAWVSWRYGGGYAGWAPLPPETLVGAEYEEPGVDVSLGFHFGSDVDVSFNIGPGWYNFVPADQIGAPDCRRVIINHYKNYVVIDKTTNITNINVNRSGVQGGPGQFGGVIVNGPSIAEVNSHAKYHVATVQLTAASQPNPGTLHGNTLAVFAPRVDPATLHQARPASVAQTIGHPSFNRGDTITQPLAVTAHVQPPAPNETEVHAAQQAQSQVPSNARIATEKMPVKQTSLASLAPLNTPSPHQTQPQTTFQPQTQAPSNPAPTFHPQNQTDENAPPENHPEAVHPPNTPPEETYHPQTQADENAPPENHPETVHPSNAPSEETFHPQNSEGSGAHPTPPSPQASHPAAPSQNGDDKPAPQKKKDDNNNQPPGH
jgi:hypothetical protein